MSETTNTRRVYTVLVPWVPPVRLNPNQRTPERTLRRLRNEGRARLTPARPLNRSPGRAASPTRSTGRRGATARTATISRAA